MLRTTMTRRRALHIAALGIGLVTGTPRRKRRRASSFPSPRADRAMRWRAILADGLQKATGTPTIVDNRSGAQGRLGVTAVKQAAPDGRTLLLTPIAPMAVYQHAYKTLAYDPIADFQPVSQVATFDFAIAVGPAGARDQREGSRGLGEGQPRQGHLRHRPQPGRFLTSSRSRSPGRHHRSAARGYRCSAAALTDLLAGRSRSW